MKDEGKEIANLSTVRSVVVGYSPLMHTALSASRSSAFNHLVVVTLQ